MNRSTLFLAAIFAFAPVSAQAAPPSLEDGARSGDRIQHKIDKLTEHLELDAKQADAIAAEMQAGHEAVRELREGAREIVEGLREAREVGDEKAMRKGLKELDDLEEAMRETKLATRDAIRAQLTIDQEVEFALIEIRRARERHGAPSQRRRGPDGERERFRGE